MAQPTTKTQQRPQPAVVETPPAPVDNLPAPRPRTTIAPIVPQNWQEITAIASAICRANMAPKSYCKTDAYGKLVYVDGKPVPEPEKVAIAIMHGMEVGMTPMTSLQSLAVINGMPSVYGDGLVALVRASGWLEDLQEGIQTDEQGKPQIAWCKVKRKGEASWKERELTYVECVRAGWTNKDGPWKLTPGRMMMVRVRGWLLRDMFADVLRGLHSAEEVEDMVDVTPQGSATVPVAEPKRTDYVAAADTTQQTGRADMQPNNQTPPVTPPRDQAGGEGEAGGTPAAGGDQDAAPGQPAPKQNVTDVTDENEIVFEDFKTARAFFEFSDGWLQEPSRTPAQARKWEEHYREKLKTLQQHEYERIRSAVQDVLALFHAVLMKEQEA